MAQEPPGAQLRFLVEHRVQIHIGVQASLHKGLNFTGACGKGRRVRGVGRVRGIHNLEDGDVEVCSGSCSLDFLFRSKQDGRNKPVFRGVNGAAKRSGA